MPHSQLVRHPPPLSLTDEKVRSDDDVMANSRGETGETEQLKTVEPSYCYYDVLNANVNV